MKVLIDLKENLTEATRYMSSLLNIKGSVLPLTEEWADLVDHNETGSEEYYGQVVVS